MLSFAVKYICQIDMIIDDETISFQKTVTNLLVKRLLIYYPPFQQEKIGQ